MWSLVVINGWWIYLLPHTEVSLLLLSFHFLSASFLLYVQFLFIVFDYDLVEVLDVI